MNQYYPNHDTDEGGSARRLTAGMNGIIHSVVSALARIGTDQTVQWLTAPKIVKADIAVRDLKVARPALIVVQDTWGPDLPLGSNRHETPITLKVVCLCNDSVAPLEAMNNLISDVMLALSADPSLGGMVQGGLFATGQVSETSPLDGGPGEAVGIVSLSGTIFWAGTAP